MVLVGVLKGPADLERARLERWYRIPAAKCPRRPFDYLAFYERGGPGRKGWIRHYAPVLGARVERRGILLPGEPDHPRSQEPYIRVRLGPVRALKNPVRNLSRSRVVFGYTTLERLLKGREYLSLFGLRPVERILERALRREGIRAVREHPVFHRGAVRHRLDLAVPMDGAGLDIECDSERAHSGPLRKALDARRDAFLRRRGWSVLRLSYREILEDLEGSIRKVRREIRRYAG